MDEKQENSTQENSGIAYVENAGMADATAKFVAVNARLGPIEGTQTTLIRDMEALKRRVSETEGQQRAGRTIVDKLVAERETLSKQVAAALADFAELRANTHQLLGEKNIVR